MKKLHILILAFVFIILVFVGFLYLTLRTKSKTVSHLQPYSEVIGEKLILDTDVLLIKNLNHYVYVNSFLIVEKNQFLSEEITEKHILKAGTPLVINGAKLFKNGVSGTTTGVVFGKVSTDFGEIEFEYIWGNEHTTLSIDEPNYFTFPKPIWKNENDTMDKRYLFDK